MGVHTLRHQELRGRRHHANFVKPVGTGQTSLTLIDSDNEIFAEKPNRQGNRKASEETHSAMDLDSKQAELEEKTRFATSLRTSLVSDQRSTKGHPRKEGRRKEEIQKKIQEYQERTKTTENNVLLGKEGKATRQSSAASTTKCRIKKELSVNNKSLLEKRVRLLNRFWTKSVRRKTHYDVSSRRWKKSNRESMR